MYETVPTTVDGSEWIDTDLESPKSTCPAVATLNFVIRTGVA
jgi:hypothetical protein